ncbi:MAG: hypothetical protein WCO13_14435 [Bacteroidota bacterium]
MEYLEIIKQNYDQWSFNGCCEEAVLLNNKIGKPYFDTASPHFFTGDLKAELVLVHLNPKRSKDSFGCKNKYISFEHYLEHFVTFGKKSYGIASSRTHKSPFDHKQVRFLKPFDLLPFRDGDKYYNLEIVVDKKLQIELVPFGSPDFNYSLIGTKNIKPFIERIINLLLSCERKYIIFCGKVFVELLQPYILKQKIHTFKLNKINGNLTIDNFEVICVQIIYNEKTINAAIAPQFAKQGYPVFQYGEMIKNLYGKF